MAVLPRVSLPLASQPSPAQDRGGKVTQLHYGELRVFGVVRLFGPSPAQGPSRRRDSERMTKFPGRSAVPKDRHRDPGISVYGLGASDAHPWLVVCPRCGACAVVRAARLVCAGCALDRISPARTEAFWLSTPCCGEELVAVNARHLDVLEGFVLATHRERRRDPATGWNNRSVTSRLPRWMKAAGNRDELARGFARLRRRLEER